MSVLAALYNGLIPSLLVEIYENRKLTRVIENSRNLEWAYGEVPYLSDAKVHRYTQSVSSFHDHCCKGEGAVDPSTYGETNYLSLLEERLRP